MEDSVTQRLEIYSITYLDVLHHATSPMSKTKQHKLDDLWKNIF